MDIHLENKEEGFSTVTLHGVNELAFFAGDLVGVTAAGTKFRLPKLPPRVKNELGYKMAMEVSKNELTNQAYKAMARGKFSFAK